MQLKYRQEVKKQKGAGKTKFRHWYTQKFLCLRRKHFQKGIETADLVSKQKKRIVNF